MERTVTQFYGCFYSPILLTCSIVRQQGNY